MSLTAVLVFLLTAALAAVNGSNDVPKGVATLAGASVTKYRTAIIWGTVTTHAGCVCSLALASKMTKLFSGGIVTAKPTDAFAIAGSAGFGLGRISGKTLRHFLIAWLVTPPFAGVVAALVFTAAH